MKNLLTLSLFLLAFQVSALEMELKPAQTHNHVTPAKIDLELDVFGLSYHTNRDYDFNEVNPGFGLSVAFKSDEPDRGYHLSMVVSAGTYKDSYSDQAKYFLVGPRATLGFEKSLHASIAIQGGYLNGSGSKGQGIVPFASIGYDWFDVGITGDPFGTGGENDAETSKMIAVFLKLRALTF